MLHVLDQDWSAARVQVVLLHAVVATHGEEGGGWTKVADSGNIFDGGDRLIRYPFSTNIPGTGLSIGGQRSASCKLSAGRLLMQGHKA